MADFALHRAVQTVPDELVTDGDDVGLQAAVIKDGAVLADAKSCVADPVRGDPQYKPLSVVTSRLLWYASERSGECRNDRGSLATKRATGMGYLTMGMSPRLGPRRVIAPDRCCSGT